MPRRGALLSLLALAPLASAATAKAQAVPSPQNNFDAAVNGMASLCPSLVRGGSIPDATTTGAFGFRPIEAPAGEHRFQSRFDDGVVQLWFEPTEHRCITHYGGPGFPAVAGFARDMASRIGFARLPLDVGQTDTRGDVFERTAADPARRERYTIMENPASQTASISYSERTIP